MNTLPAIHVCIVQPMGYVHSLGFLDQSRYLRYQFRRFGANVTIAKNRLRHGAVNFVLGAHLGFDPALRQRYSCIFVNLEQLGDGGASVSPAYMALLQTSAVVDYDAANVPAYAEVLGDVQIMPLLHAPYLAPAQTLALEDRPIDLLFIGSLNPRRQAIIERIESTGVQVTLFDHALYGPERDDFIMQAKAVLNTPFYDSARFEQARVSHCLSLGTPVISERRPMGGHHPAFEQSVTWVDDNQLETFFAKQFGTPAFFDDARVQVAAFRDADPMEAYADLLAFAAGFGQVHHERRPQGAWAPTLIHLGSGKDYKPGWLNLDVIERAQPDLLLNLAEPLTLPLALESDMVGPVVIEEGSVDIIHANNVLEHVPDLVTLMSNGLRLLKVGGEFQIEVPYERALSAWQDPTHVRAMNENSWVYYTDWFWYLGWFEHRFEVSASSYLDASVNPCGQDQAAFMRVTLRKIETSLQERMQARTMQPDLRIPDDEVVCWQPQADEVEFEVDALSAQVPASKAPRSRAAAAVDA